MMSLAVPEFTLLALPSGFPLRAPAGSHARAKKVSFVAAGNFHFPPWPPRVVNLVALSTPTLYPFK